jgi:multidrug efflux pump subunit AcrA (membrane-fusion protein)
MKPDAHAQRASHTQQAALAAAATPRSVRILARLFFLLFLATPFLLIFVPWQQTVNCRGMVVAFSPVERMQVLTARVSGQVRTWHVVEGTRVKMNDPVVDIEDNDPELAQRLEAQREFLQGRLARVPPGPPGGAPRRGGGADGRGPGPGRGPRRGGEGGGGES